MSIGDPQHPVPMTRLECIWLLRRLRADRDKLRDDMLLIEERIRAGNDGQLENAHRALDADVMIAGGLINKLWQICGK